MVVVDVSVAVVVVVSVMVVVVVPVSVVAVLVVCVVVDVVVVLVVFVVLVVGHLSSPGMQSVAPTHALPFLLLGVATLWFRCPAASHAVVQVSCVSMQSTLPAS